MAIHRSDYDVLVIGGGPAGLMAAGQAAESKVRTLLIERMDRPGRKLQLTGKGRCNLTNIAELDDFISHFGRKGRFLRSSFSRFFSSDLLDFMSKLGIETQAERGGRVFPVSKDALEIVDALERWNRQSGVELVTTKRVFKVGVDSQGTLQVSTRSSSPNTRGGSNEPSTYNTKAVIVATGGRSYPGTGSTGDGYQFAIDLGHTVIPPRPALVPLVTKGDTASNLQGLSLRNVGVSLIVDNKRIKSAFGEMLFTHFGLSGPVVLSLSREAVVALEQKATVEISIDLKPALDDTQLEARLLRDIDSHGRQQYRTLLKGLLPAKMITTCIHQTGIPAEREAHQISAEERYRLRSWLKDLRFDVVDHRSFRQAIITAGGVHLKEIDPRTMGSKLCPGMYFAGEVLDLDADTGGFNLQAAFSTGWVAGRAAAAYALESN